MNTHDDMVAPATGKRVRHILSVSGGKDSTALAIYMRDKVPEMEYVFCDTGEELPETYDYLERLEAHLGRPIIRLNPDRPFKHYLTVYGGMLPDARTRWCTRMLKILPFERYVGEDLVISYIAIRADEEDRKGYISAKGNIIPSYPFIQARVTKSETVRLLEDCGIGLPSFYRWRSRSGCYFCFFQQRIEWVGLLQNHPELFQKALAIELECVDRARGESFTWIPGESLMELSRPERVQAIIDESSAAEARNSCQKGNGRLRDILGYGDAVAEPCTICRL